jgi:UDP-glucose 4-epimerase
MSYTCGMLLPEMLKDLPEDIREAFSGKEVLITGGLGFIGSNLAHALVPLGAKVTILDALLPPYGGNRFNVADIAEKLELIDGDIRDKALLDTLVVGKDFIFHLAGQVSYIDSKTKPFDDLDFNGRGNLTVLEAVREHAPTARILFSSSRLVYGKILTLPVREDHPTNPLSLYGIHKLLGEKYYRYYAHEFGIHGVSLRIPNPYGPRQQMKHGKYSIVGWFLRQALEDKVISIYGDGTQERDYIYITDIIDALLRLIVKGEAGEVYNVGSPERLRFVDMVDAIIKEVGSGSKEHVPWPATYERNETGDYIADTSRLAHVTGWRARVHFQEGLREMARYYRDHRAEYW